MQRLFAEQTEWHAPWMARVRPIVHRVAQRCPERTIFTRFIPPDRPGDGNYERWASMTLERLEPGMIDLVPELASLVPPAEVVDKNLDAKGNGDCMDAVRRANQSLQGN